MAKIVSVTLDKIPNEIVLGDSLSDLTVLTKIEFHDLDISLTMAYCLQLYVYEVRGSLDTPVVLSNWDETRVISVSKDRVDVLLGKSSTILDAQNKVTEIETPMTLQLGKHSESGSNHTRKLGVFATIVPAIERASAWSKSFETRILH